MMKAKCLVLGGAGFIGSHLVKDLIIAGYEVRVFEVKNFSTINIKNHLDLIEIYEGNFSNPADLREAIKGIDYVFHLISSTLPANSVLNAVFDIESNLVSSIQLMQICLEVKIKKLVFISSGGTVYGIPNSIPIKENHSCNPLNSYGIIKRAIENYMLLYNNLWGLNTCIFRLSNPYGENQNPFGKQGAISVFLHKAILGETIDIWGDGEVIRDYIYINDVTDILIKSLLLETPELIYNLGSGIGYSLNQILKFIEFITEKKISIKYSDERAIDVKVNILDNSLLINRFRVKPQIDIITGIELLHQHIIDKFTNEICSFRY